MPRPFNSRGQGTLMSGAGAAFAARRYFTPICYIRTQLGRIFIVDVLNFITAEQTYLALGDISTP